MVGKLNETKLVLALQLKQLRENKSITIEDLSQFLKIDKKWLIRLESGKANIEWYYLLKLAEFYEKKIRLSFED